MAKIVFFNHYHRGDLHTHKEFIRQIKDELKDEVEYEYLHFNHPKLTIDLDIPKVGDPGHLDPKTPFYNDDDALYINTWIGCHWDLFCKHGGINMDSLQASWNVIFNMVNKCFDTNLIMKEKEFYLPSIDYSKFDTSNIQEYIEKNSEYKKILICNGSVKSGQSFQPNMKEQLEQVAPKYSKIHFICTEKFDTDIPNILFTDDIIRDNQVSDTRAPWEDRKINTCDMQEISYLSTLCEAIVGKNSGPYVFCETKENYMNENKKFLSFNSSWGNAFHSGIPGTTETMSWDLKFNAEYNIVMIGWSDDGKTKLDHTILNERDQKIVTNALDKLAAGL